MRKEEALVRHNNLLNFSIFLLIILSFTIDIGFLREVLQKIIFLENESLYKFNTVGGLMCYPILSFCLIFLLQRNSVFCGKLLW